MSTLRLPERPIDENWPRDRDEWVAAVTALMDEAERWSRSQDWDVRRQTKPMYESELGSYELPRLLLHNGIGRVLLDPVARFVSGLEGGAVELLTVPDYDGWLLAREWGRWTFYDSFDGVERQPWTEDVFVAAVNRVAKP